MPVRTRIAALLAALVLTLGLSSAVASPAHAAYIDCWTGYACVFDGQNGTGALLFASNAPRGSCVNIPSSVNDRATSYVNRLSGRGFQVYRDAGCQGHALHKDNGYGGSTQPFPPLNAPYPTYLNASGNFINIDNEVLPGCGHPDHCDNNIASSFFFNNG